MSQALLNSRPTHQNVQTTVKLQNIILPNLDICTVEELYFRLDSKFSMNYEQNIIEINKSEIISFDTYFNSFSIQKWQEHTNINYININLNVKGKFKINLLNINYSSQIKGLVHQKIITNTELKEVCVFNDIDTQPYKGLLYLELEPLEDNCIFAGGYFYANGNINNFCKSNQKIAIVICTYKRESYVNRNVSLLETHLFSQPDIGNKFEVFIIDNGRTIKDFCNSKIHVIPNKNAGGTGGYCRGIIEVIKRKSDFSHIVFMDDDVVINPEVFERIYNFQTVAHNQNLCLGGSMLRLDTKYIQYENGAVWNKEVIRLKPDLDLRTVRNILLNEIEEHLSYNGWWLFCFPIKSIDDSKLPYPFFIKMDDMEFPIRLNHKIITLNGVCVWHEALENKYSPMMNYYLKKNELILNVIVSDDFSKLDAIKRIIKFTLREAFCYKYQSANVILKAAADFLKGPRHLTEIDPEEKNIEIRSMGEKCVKDTELPFMYIKYEESVNKIESTMHRWLRFITLNGHLLPSPFFYQDIKLTGQGYKVVPMQEYRPTNVFRARKALYYNLINQEGFVVSFSREEFFKVLMKTLALSVEIYFKFSQLKQDYRETLPELTNREFWETYLETDKYSKLI